MPPVGELREEHRWLATELLRVGVDIVLIETMNTLREARVALEQVPSAGGRASVSFVCGQGGRLLSGEPAATPPPRWGRRRRAVLLNCTPVVDTEVALRHMQDSYDALLGAYPNVERGAAHDRNDPPEAVSLEAFASALARWRDDLGASVVDGCCGAGPAHIAASAPGSSPTVEAAEDHRQCMPMKSRRPGSHASSYENSQLAGLERLGTVVAREQA